jgi:signal transduction histidine kinase
MRQEMQPSGSHGPARLQRFPLQMPMRYRYAGAYQWYRGITENISCSGMLFRGPVQVDAMAPVEVRMALPRQMTGEAAATMLCGGFIARVLETKSTLQESKLAATFTTYRLLTTNGHRRSEAVNLSEKATEAARDDLLEQFVHEFRNMLEIVIGHADLILMKEDLDVTIRTSALRIRDAGERAATLTKALAG